MVKQMATADSFSETQRQRRRITCAARPKPIARSALSRRTLQPHYSGREHPLKKPPQARFPPHRFRLSTTTVSSEDEHPHRMHSFAVQSFVATLRQLPILGQLDCLSLEIAPAHLGLLPPATSDLGCAVQHELPAIARLDARGPYGRSRCNFTNLMPTNGDEGHNRNRPCVDATHADGPNWVSPFSKASARGRSAT
jgi:hypothetical protein